MNTKSDGLSESLRANEDLAGLLSDPHIRHLMVYLSHHNGPIDVSTVAAHVAAGITDTPLEEVSDDTRLRVQTFLHHGQLPELARQGIIEFDRKSNTVSLRN